MLNKAFLSSIAAIFTAAVGVVVLQNAFAATGLIKLQPVSGSTEKGNNFSVNIVIDPGTAIDGVEASISYDTAKLQFVSIDSGGSAFPIQLAQSGGGGTVNVTRGILGGSVSANGSFIAKVTFKALAGGTTATLDLSGNSTASGEYQNPSIQDATRTLTNPVVSNPDPEPEPDPDPTPAPSPDPDEPDDGGGSSKPKPNKPGNNGGNNGGGSGDGGGGSNNKPPVTKPNKPEQVGICKVKLLPPAFRKLVFEISGEKACKAYIVYGDGNELDLSTPISKLEKNQKIALDENLLTPGTEYSYKVVVKDQSGKTVESPVRSVKTKGYTVRAKILSGDNQPIKNKLVTLRSDPITSRTDENGIATFNDVSPGEHTIIYEDGGTEFKKQINVLDTVKAATATSAESQTFAVVYSEVSQQAINPGLIAALVGLVVAVGFALAFGLGKFSKNKPAGIYVAPNGSEGYGASDVVVGGKNSNANDSSAVGDMLNKVEGGKRSDPGTVVSPEDKDK